MCSALLFIAAFFGVVISATSLPAFVICTAPDLLTREALHGRSTGTRALRLQYLSTLRQSVMLGTHGHSFLGADFSSKQINNLTFIPLQLHLLCPVSPCSLGDL